MTRRFDSLVHVTASGGWQNGRDDASLPRLIAELDHADVARACLVGVVGVCSNDDVLWAWRQHPARFVPIAGVNPVAHADPAAMVAALTGLRAQGFAGVKLHPRANSYDPRDERCQAVFAAAGDLGLVVFLDTLFRQRGVVLPDAPTLIDATAARHPGTRTVLLHGGGPALLEVFDIVRMHRHLLLDLSFSLLRYAGSSLDADIAFVCHGLDRHLTLGSDMPEYTPAETYARFAALTPDLPADKRDRILGGNLDALFTPWAAA